MKKRNIQKAIVNNWIHLYIALSADDINFYEFQVAESTLSELSDDLLNVDNVRWLVLNYIHYHLGLVENWDMVYSYLDDTTDKTLFIKAINELGYEVS